MYINKFNTSEEFEAAKNELSLLSHYLVYDASTDEMCLKDIDRIRIITDDSNFSTFAEILSDGSELEHQINSNPFLFEDAINGFRIKNTNGDAGSFHSSVLSISFNEYNTSNITDMSYMFNGCNLLTNLDLSSFYTLNVTKIDNMFSGCAELMTLNLENFDTSHVIGDSNMADMFNGCEKLRYIKCNQKFKDWCISNQDIIKLPDAMREGGSGTWYTSEVKSPKITINTDGSNNSSFVERLNDGRETEYLMIYTPFLVSDAEYGFKFKNTNNNVSSVLSILFDSYDTSHITDMSDMFSGCSKLSSIDFSEFNTSGVTTMRNMFNECNELTSLDLSSFDTSMVTDMYSMFTNCYKLESVNLSTINTSNVTSMNRMFSNCNSLTSLDLSSFDTSMVTDMYSMFSNASSLEELLLTSFNTSNVQDMYGMFMNCKKLVNIDLSSFDTSNVTTMYGMFYECNKLETLNLSSFDTTNVGDVSYMFTNCNSLTSIDLSNFNVTNAASSNKVDGMFYNCLSLTNIKCTKAFKEWCITNSPTISLPNAMLNGTVGAVGSGSNWELIDYVEE